MLNRLLLQPSPKFLQSFEKLNWMIEPRRGWAEGPEVLDLEL